MNFKEFVERYKKEDTDLVKEVVFKKYLPIRDKLKITDGIIDKLEKTVGTDVQAPLFVKMKEIYIFFSMLGAYSNIEIEEDDVTEEMYDFCQASGIERFISFNTVEGETSRFRKIASEMMDVNTVLALNKALTLPSEEKLMNNIQSFSDTLNAEHETIDKVYEMIMPRVKK